MDKLWKDIEWWKLFHISLHEYQEEMCAGLEKIFILKTGDEKKHEQRDASAISAF